MLQRLLIITLTLFSLTASAQWQQTGSKVRYVNGLGIPTKDTAAGVAADSSQILIRPADSSLYIKYKRTWVKVGAGGGGTIGGSGTTNYVPKFTAGTTLGNSQIFDNGTNVGIGTASPTFKLDVNGNGNFGFGIQISNSGAGLTYSASKYMLQMETPSIARSYVCGVDASTYGAYEFYNARSNGTPLIGFALTGAGNFGIGTSAPAAKLSVQGTALINTNTDNGVDKLQVSGSAIASTLKVNTSGQTVSISSYYNGGTGNNIWVGGGGLSSTSAASLNSSFGQNALLSNTSGELNAAFSAEAMQNNTTGVRNLAIGGQALKTNTTGSRNMALGAGALFTSNSDDNVAIGSQTLINLSSGANNVGIGSNALFNATTGTNTAIGQAAMYETTTGTQCVAVGASAGRRISGGSGNQTSNQSIYIGEDTRASANGNTNEMVFGHTAIGQGSNTVTLGNSSITKTFLRGNTMVNTTTDNGVDELQVNGSISGIGFKQAYVTKTGAYTATNDDYVIDCTSGTFTVTLPASSGRTGRILIIKNSGAGTITVDGNASETIDGATTYSLSVQYATVQIMSDGTNWKIISKF